MSWREFGVICVQTFNADTNIESTTFNNNMTTLIFIIKIQKKFI